MTKIERPATGRAGPARPVGQTWAIVLAGGDGSRLRSLTTDAMGLSVPKQFCSLRGGPSLLYDALRRAETAVNLARVCAVVARQHRRWWAPWLAGFPRDNVIEQPQNRGTANGVLLALACLLERDPLANVVVLPSDHYVRDETTLCAAMLRALRAVRTDEMEIVLLGMVPEHADPELGYIVPQERARDVPVSVRRFVEKPPSREAATLIADGALWNAFILAARARSLVDLIRAKDAALVERMRGAWRLDAHSLTGYSAVNALYRNLLPLDFSRDVAEGREASLSVLRVPPCGWSDLGTPERVARALLKPGSLGAEHAARSAPLSLAERLRQRDPAAVAGL